MNLEKVNKMYFLGIGGIGMSALARYFHQRGVEIHGYDLTSGPLTEALQKEGMYVHFDDNIKKIPENIDLAVYTPAIPADNSELAFFRKIQKPLLKRAELIEQLTKDHFTIAVAGTHGKTSISSLTAHLLKSAGKNITALVGGICKNYNSNLVSSIKTDYFLVEADEFDRSFLKLKPNISLVSSMDADHLDIYGSHEELKKNFKAFVNNTVEGGTLVYNLKLKELNTFPGNKVSYGLKTTANFRANKIRIVEGRFNFNIFYGDIIIKNISLQVPGYHYVENALAAVAIAFELGLTADEVKKGLESFEGVERRFEFHVNTLKTVYIDDYAHHPEEIRVTLEAARKLFPGRKICGIFQPHLYSRTRDFAEGFAQSLDQLDEIILLNIYPARELSIPGITSKVIFDLMKNPNKILIEKENLIPFLEKKNVDVLITIGAGDIGMMTEKIKNLLAQQ
jgi:UDP-N-acetylmuramate--alanine ligase